MSPRGKTTVKELECEKVKGPYVAAAGTKLSESQDEAKVGGCVPELEQKSSKRMEARRSSDCDCTPSPCPSDDPCSTAFFKFLYEFKTRSGRRFNEHELAQFAAKYEASVRDGKLHGHKAFNVIREKLAKHYQMTLDQVDELILSAEFNESDYDYENGSESNSSTAAGVGSEDDYYAKHADVASEAAEDKDEDYEDVDDSGEEIDIDEDDMPVVCCSNCLRNKCSNCLVTLKKGDMKHDKIPSLQHVFDEKLDYVSLEVALVCVFDHASPFQKWNRAMEMKADQIKKLNSTKAFSKVEKTKKPEANNNKKKDKGKEQKPKVEKELKKVNCNSKADSPTPNCENKGEDDIFKKCLIAVEEKAAANEIKAKRIADEIWKTDRKLPDFYLCSGCAELLSILFTIWERLETKLLAEDMYFHTVMMAFGLAKKARNVIYHPPKGSKFNVFQKYSRKCHPVGCYQRTTEKGGRIDLKLEDKDALMKQAVGNLIFFLQEAYSRVTNEILKEMFLNFEWEDVPILWG